MRKWYKKRHFRPIPPPSVSFTIMWKEGFGKHKPLRCKKFPVLTS